MDASNADASEDDVGNVVSKDSDAEKVARRMAWNATWANTFEWLYFDDACARMFCKYCEQDKDCLSEFR